MKDSAARAELTSPDGFVAFGLAECNQALHQRFEQQVLRQPSAPAVRLPSGDVSYAELNAAANRAARTLLAATGTMARPVALMLDQGLDSVRWTLAILKAGSCYAPLDQRLSEPVLRAIVDNLGPGALVAAANYRDACRHLAAGRFPVIDAGHFPNRHDDEPVETNLDRSIAPDDIAYVFYTSGSTGTPKGVADSHRNALHNVMRYTNSLRFAPGDTLSLVQNPSFSGTVSSLFGALLNGAAIAPFDLKGKGLDTISRWLRQAQVTVFHGVPSIFRLLSDPVGRFPNVRVIRLEGDRSSAADLRHFRVNFRDDCTLVNGLGATECGLVRQYFVSQHTIPTGESVPIGYPVPDVEIAIVDEGGQTLPPGTIGEIAVEGRFLATGYWRNPALTSQRFSETERGLRRYRTGDLGRMDEDGCLTHLGRVDHGIRIAGEFVDPGNIETELLGVSGVLHGVVRDYVDQAGERRLCAYLVVDRDASVTVDRLRLALSKRFARKVVPMTFVFLDALPLTKDLKVDPRLLPAPGRERPSLPNDYVAPRTALEHQMAAVWSEVLEIEQVGVTDSFFDLGGDSLRAAQVVSRLRDRHGVSIQVSNLFEHMSVRALAKSLNDPRPTNGQFALSEDTRD